MLHTREEIEAELERVMEDLDFPRMTLEYERLLGIMGNVEGDEIIALVVLAVEHYVREGG
jgi:hypothetical protein